MQHGLTEFVLPIRILDLIRLVDDVDEMDGFGYPPEHLSQSDVEILIGKGASPVELAHIDMGALRVFEVPANEGDDDESLVAISPVVIELWLEGNGETGVLLTSIQGVTREETAFERDLSRQVGRCNRLCDE